MPEPPPPPLADAEEPPPPEADDAPPPSLPPQPAQPPAAARSSATSVSSAAAAAAAAASFPPDDALLYSCDAALLVTVKATLAGRLDIHRKHVHFEAAPPQPGASPAAGPPPYSAPPPPPSKSHWRWPVSSLVSVHCQRYCLQARALELFTDTRTSAFVALPSRPELRRAAAALLRARPGLLLLDRRRKAEAAARACDRWRRRELSTFHYLTLLNTLAGRTFNDLAQYPVFPWVIADYSSDELDVRCPGALRDLSRPVGALNPASRPSLVERFASLSRDGDGDGSLPPFHHGSHYSTPGGVLHWLLRLQPFTELHRALHGGSFDKADRLFGSLPGAWGAAWRNGSDVKELTPEFFTSPEFLINSGGHALGTRQDGSRVGDVALPPWAGGDAAAFVRANAAVLESEPVSQSIHGWIDLIFGHAQKGPPAEEALNVFFHLTYEGGVDLSRVPPDQRASLADQIALFGQARIAERRICKCQLLNQYLLQIPTQLFTRKHPRRDPPLWLPPRLSAASWQHGGCFHAPPEVALQADARAIASPSTAHPRHSGGVRFLWVTPDGRVGALTDGGVVGWHALGRPGGGMAGASAAPPSAASAASAAGAAALAAAAASGGIFAYGAAAALALIDGPATLSPAPADDAARPPPPSAAPPRADGSPATHPPLLLPPPSPACGGGGGGGHWATPLIGRCAAPLLGGHFLAVAHHFDGRLRLLAPDEAGDAWRHRVAAVLPLGCGAVATCVAASSDALVAGCSDATLRVWQVRSPADVAELGASPAPRCVIPSHDAPISCVAASEQADVIASACEAGVVLIHVLRRCCGPAPSAPPPPLRRMVLPPGDAPAALLIADAAGAVICLSQSVSSSRLWSWSVNARRTGAATPNSRVTALAITPDGLACLSADAVGRVALRCAGSLAVVACVCAQPGPPPRSRITSLCPASDDGSALLVGDAAGRVQLWASARVRTPAD